MWRVYAQKREDDFVIMAAGFMFLQSCHRKNERRFWVRPSLRKRNEYGIEKLLADLRKDDIGLRGEMRSSFQNFLRMSSENFEDLIQVVGPAIYKRNTNYRNAISVEERLAITLRFLATGDSYHSLMYQSKIPPSSSQNIVCVSVLICFLVVHTATTVLAEMKTKQKPFDLYRLATGQR